MIMASILKNILTVSLDVISARRQTSKRDMLHCEKEFKNTRNMKAQQFLVSEQRIEKADGTINCSALQTKKNANTKVMENIPIFHNIFRTGTGLAQLSFCVAIPL